MFINSKEGSNLTILDNGFEFEIKKEGNTIEEVLLNAGFEIKEEDMIFPLKETILGPSLKIIINRAIPVILNLYGNREKIFTQKKKIKEFLEERKINLGKEDIINYKLETEIFPEIEIKISKKPKPKPKPEIIKTGKKEEGLASWYRYISGNYCASRTFKKGEKLLVTNIENNRQIIVTVNDYGPMECTGKIIDLEATAFAKLSPLFRGVIKVKIEKINIK